ncbi:MAG: UDP-N-acetylglucosamine 2-epimerase (non-hydrolyzing) [Thermoanaerobaculia bacterium]
MLTRQTETATLLFVIGTRPEAIKLAPVILQARKDSSLSVRVCATAQHRELLDTVFTTFGIEPDVDLGVMTFDQTPAVVASQVVSAVAGVIERERPQWVVVQGDTVSTFASSLAAFYSRVPVAHVEAGLRTSDPLTPWPEEMNRRLTTGIARLHFAPTEGARAHLLREGVHPDAIEVTGNTVVDAVRLIAERSTNGGTGSLVDSVVPQDGSRIVLVTVHRRENLGARLDAVCSALRPIVEAVPDAAVVIISHPNPAARASVSRFLDAGPAHQRIRAVEPLDYGSFLELLGRSHVVMTDSGGIQEEAPIFGKPVLILRDLTERPELLASGSGLLVGTDAEAIASGCIRLLTDDSLYAAMSRTSSPFGDGGAAERIVRRLRREL